MTASGDHRQQVISPDKAVVLDDWIVARGLYPPGQVRLSATIWFAGGSGAGTDHRGPVIMGSTMYDTSYLTKDGSGNATQKQVTRVGPGWQVYRTLDRSTYVTATQHRETEYSLHNDGTLYRRNVTYKNGVASRQITGWQSGYRGVKAMTLISQTATYDTFLMTLTSGKLYTARLPLAGGHIIPGVVKQVRNGTWQGFESLVSAPCGFDTLLLGIDRDTGSAYLYDVGHANGAATPIRMIGKMPGTYKDPVYFHFQGDTNEHPSGD
ncbi:hypothetical protein [Kribbella speibonae]|uniref:Uncharacterized protein n=1 Tax=Kribbella speibonae TaxID=1572660 RepID=A0A4R0IX97_9ACTN|nr:hypothetical protein [Kribbella speibonae]TCC25424.1 hypothetical protein E0H58_14865 [Kribbella speibonae]TCC37550.1 hypothetical protein E0H92_13570 [Kribbella speibonae]